MQSTSRIARRRGQVANQTSLSILSWRIGAVLLIIIILLILYQNIVNEDDLSYFRSLDQQHQQYQHQHQPPNHSQSGTRGGGKEQQIEKTTTSTTTTTLPKLSKFPLQPSSVEDVWTDLLQEASSIPTQTFAAAEVGMYRAHQCIQAARAGLHAYCFEPSPANFRNVQRGINSLKGDDDDVKKRLHVYDKAVSSKSGEKIPFLSSGSTGDHIGGANMWKMELEEQSNSDTKSTVEVETIALDDIILEKNLQLFVIKIDTQGYEPSVFEGLKQSIRDTKIKFILTEYWPSGMDLIAQKPRKSCIASDLLQTLVDAGYTLFTFDVVAHPKAPQGWRQGKSSRPLGDDLKKNCLWYYEMEERFPSEEYKMGYWTDVLAVAPGVLPLVNPKTGSGKALSGLFSR